MGGDEKYQVALLGACGVGKSSLVIRFVNGYFVEDHDVTVEDEYLKTVHLADNKKVTLRILDTAGQEDFPLNEAHVISQEQGFIVVYAIDSLTSFEQARNYLQKITKLRGQNKVPVILVGNKCDLRTTTSSGQVTKSQAEQLAASYGCWLSPECSAKDKINHEQCFLDLILELQHHHQRADPQGSASCTLL
eukprot:TRINITY_DN10859_c0_g4_i1.p1 TRINITY_DN10859_c0_g4~~TRINITY_DN10859_c0_g4_i1.p1  ORF type:complete len:191 (-),score=34.47 TRINITY_DN10859_c0_g4_i1:78-650(-)